MESARRINVGASIRAAVIHQDQREVAVTLRSQGRKRGPYSSGLVTERNNDPEAGTRIGLFCLAIVVAVSIDLALVRSSAICQIPNVPAAHRARATQLSPRA